MIWVLIGLAGLLGLIALGRSAAAADPARLAQRVRAGAAIAAIAAGLVFLARGAFLIAAPLIGFGVSALASQRRPSRRADQEGGAGSDGGGRDGRHEGRAEYGAARPGADMTREEAFAVLGLEPSAGDGAIREAHKRLIKRLHPDGGGSSALAAKVNRARQVLLGPRG